MNCRNTRTPSTRRTRGWFKVGLLGAAFAFFGISAHAQTIWDSGSLPFANAAGAGTDNITAQTALTRATTLPIYNSACEGSAAQSCSWNPCNTAWAYGTIANWNTLTYGNLFNVNGCNPPSMVGQTMVCHLIAENIYLQITWNSWGAGGAGGFSYTRTTGPSGPPCPSPATINPSSANYCSGNPGIVLTASGAITYSWAPAAGLSATTGTSVTASPTVTTTYTVSGTGDGGCLNSGTSTITVLGTAPTITSTTATPGTICPGSSSQLQVNVAGPSAYCATSYSTGTQFGDYLSSVAIGGTTLNNPTGAGASPYYTLYPASGSTTASLSANTAYTLTVIGGTYTSNDVAAWIDYNGDGVFTDATEKLGEIDNFGATPTAVNINFTVPAGAVNGAARLRVREADQSGVMPACGGLTYGEVEDYTVTISGGAAAASFLWSPNTFLSSATIADPLASNVSATTAYTVTVTNGSGCSSQGTATVSVVTVDDGNPCTLDACLNGVVTNTFQDADADGICDANDNCPNFPGQQGDACDDGNVNTTGDVITALCVCAGTSAVDCEGTPSGPAQPGTACNDNNVCTINDLWSASCVCTGTFQDTDGDGVCNANDNCPNVAGQIGSSCTDGNACTINDVLNASCVCTGTSAPVTAGVNASGPAYCTPGPGVTLTASGGDTYSWAPAASLSASTGNPVTATPATATTYTVTATNAVGCTGTATVTVNAGVTPATPIMSATPTTVCPGSNAQLGATIGAAASYCTATHTNGCTFGDEYMSNVTFGSINNSSTCAQNGPGQYSDYTAISTSVTAGATGLPISFGCPNFFSGDQGKVYIDWNQNGVLNDLGEEYTLAGSTTFSGTVNVPVGAINGSTRMRVRLFYVGTTSPCGAASYGETEDYTLNVTGGASACAPGINFSWSPTTYLNNAAICNPLASGVLVATAYTVTATNAGGCSSTGNITVNVETTDTDGDLTVDCADGCPNDANKIAPGQCGCGVADTDTDGDLTADCNDGCPADANKIAPGICGCGVADTDTDGDATADCNDGCPTDPNKLAPGQCGCGVADTDTDSDGTADCIDNCPNVAGVVGTPCNDGNAGTINDVITAGCVCAGTVPACAFNTVLLDLVTDLNGGQTSWDVVNVSTTTVVCSGSGYLNNQTITVDCCLPNGCYELRVFDSAGDGMANGPVGGYVLRAPGSGNKRIIDNSGDGIFTSTSQIANNLGFCVPIGTDAPIASSCDKNNWLPNDILQATANPAVTGQYGVTNSTSGYQFWFFNPDGGYSRRVTQTHAAPGSVTGPAANVRSSYLKLSSIVTQPLPFYTNLNIRIRTQVAGVFSQFGPACRFRLDPPCSTTQLTTVADPVVSCSATGLSLTSTIYATAVAGASTYQFEFSKAGYLRRISQSVRSTALSFVTNPLQNNSCYQVRVRVSFDGAVSFCPFGPTCNITIGNALCGSAMALDAAEGLNQAAEGQLTVWPNPNDGSLVNMSLTRFNVNVNTVGVDVTDVYGKLVSTRTIPVQDGTLKTTLTFEQELAPGLYLVNLTAGEKRYTERLVIQ